MVYINLTEGHSHDACKHWPQKVRSGGCRISNVGIHQQAFMISFSTELSQSAVWHSVQDNLHPFYKQTTQGMQPADKHVSDPITGTMQECGYPSISTPSAVHWWRKVLYTIYATYKHVQWKILMLFTTRSSKDLNVNICIWIWINYITDSLLGGVHCADFLEEMFPILLEEVCKSMWFQHDAVPLLLLLHIKCAINLIATFQGEMDCT
jgi:hypothetical protein